MALLTDDQIVLLGEIVEASRRAKCEFWAAQQMDGPAVIQHPGFDGGNRPEVYWPDLLALANAGMFTVVRPGDGHFSFAVSPAFRS